MSVCLSFLLSVFVGGGGLLDQSGAHNAASVAISGGWVQMEQGDRRVHTDLLWVCLSGATISGDSVLRVDSCL